MSSKLGEILIRKGFISEGQVTDALACQNEEGGLLGSILINKGFAREDQIHRASGNRNHGFEPGPHVYASATLRGR